MVDAVEQLEVALPLEFGKRLTNGFAYDIAVPDQLQIMGIRQLVDVGGATQHADDRRRLLQERTKLIILGSHLLEGRLGHRGFGFRCGHVTPLGRLHAMPHGRVNQKRLPSPGWLTTPISPPWASTRPLAMLSPSPAPPAGRLKLMSSC
ncbi:hypothetical protein D3C72_598180 [compost metagenome]